MRNVHAHSSHPNQLVLNTFWDGKCTLFWHNHLQFQSVDNILSQRCCRFFLRIKVITKSRSSWIEHQTNHASLFMLVVIWYSLFYISPFVQRLAKLLNGRSGSGRGRKPVDSALSPGTPAGHNANSAMTGKPSTATTWLCLARTIFRASHLTSLSSHKLS
jgi:hypothetical protein